MSQPTDSEAKSPDTELPQPAPSTSVEVTAPSMTFDRIYENVRNHTTTSSALARQLALAGIAVVWLFAGGFNPKSIVLGHNLAWALLAFVVALLLDAVQYLYLSLAWMIFLAVSRRKFESEGDKTSPTADDRSEVAPTWINWFGNVCWLVKSLAVLAGYVLLAVELSKALSII
jgi:hypothetical protein